jgi:hypothetical protein
MGITGKSPLQFPETRWSLVGRAAGSNQEIRQRALTELLLAYCPGLRAFLIRGRRLSPDMADELLQQFIADKVLTRKLLQRADRGKGKFRNYVLKSLSNFVSTKLTAKYAQPTTAVGIDPAMVPDTDLATDIFQREWLQQVVRDALQLMEVDCRARGRTDYWEIFQLRVVGPMLDGSPTAEYDEVVKKFGFTAPRQAMNLLANAKRCFTNHLRAAVGRYVPEEHIDEEIAELRNFIAR